MRSTNENMGCSNWRSACCYLFSATLYTTLRRQKQQWPPQWLAQVSLFAHKRLRTGELAITDRPMLVAGASAIRVVEQRAAAVMPGLAGGGSAAALRSLS